MKILIVQTAFIGDIILSAPVVELLKRSYPTAELWILTTKAGAELFASDPRIAGVLTFEKRGSERGLIGLRRKACELREQNFAVVYSLHRSARTAVLLALARIPRRIGFADAHLPWLYTETRKRVGGHEIQRKLALIDQTAVVGTPDLLVLHPPPLEQCSREMQEWLADERRYVLLAPGSAWATKQWKWQGFRKVGELLRAQGLRIAVIGAPNEREIASTVCDGLDFENWAGRTSLGEMLHLAKNADLIVCNDSMVLHLASSFETPVVSVFCATSPTFGFGPWNASGRVVELSGLSCKPCRPHGGLSCPTGTWRCMREVTPEVVFAVASEVAQ